MPTKRDIIAADDESLVDALEEVGANVGQALAQCKNPSKWLEKEIRWIKDEILKRMKQ